MISTACPTSSVIKLNCSRTVASRRGANAVPASCVCHPAGRRPGTALSPAMANRAAAENSVRLRWRNSGLSTGVGSFAGLFAKALRQAEALAPVHSRPTPVMSLPNWPICCCNALLNNALLRPREADLLADCDTMEALKTAEVRGLFRMNA